MSTTKFSMTRDINGYNGFGLDFSDVNYSMLLLQNTPQSITVPSDSEYYIAIFTYQPGSSVWVSNSGNADFPTGSVSYTLSQQNPSARRVKGGTTISFITNDQTNDEVGVELYSLYYRG